MMVMQSMFCLRCKFWKVWVPLSKGAVEKKDVSGVVKDGGAVDVLFVVQILESVEQVSSRDKKGMRSFRICLVLLFFLLVFASALCLLRATSCSIGSSVPRANRPSSSVPRVDRSASPLRRSIYSSVQRAGMANWATISLDLVVG
ncbi:hypothetical protein QYF36_027185 [Acer negundo]|nr:hypothetical protein QYF36_027185 [Acer negundo]